MEKLITLLSAGLAAFAEKLAPPSQTVDKNRRANIVAVNDKYKLSKVTEPTVVRTHRVDNLDSLVAYLKRHGVAADTTVFVDRAGVVAVLNDTQDADRDAIKVPLTRSVEMKAWAEIVGSKLKHTAFRDAVQDRVNDLDDESRGLAALLGQFRARQSVEIDSNTTDGNTLGFVLHEGAQASGAKLPGKFGLAIPLFLAWPVKYGLSVRLECEVDAADKEKRPNVYFKSAWRDLDDAIDLAVRDMQAHLAETLGDGWLVVAGAPSAKLAE